MTPAPRVLIVDDNSSYRDAFRRNLLLKGYEAIDAEDSEDALAKLGSHPVDVVITDLSMRHPTEGLDLIRQVRSLQPHVPVIMISAVGTFEEGAEATRLGARQVISKSRIDEEIDNLYRAIDHAYDAYQRDLALAQRLTELEAMARTDPARAAAELRDLIRRADASPSIKSAAFDLLMELSGAELADSSREDLDRARASIARSRELFDRVDANLRQAVPAFETLDHETRETLRTAEFLYLHDEQLGRAVDFSRSIGFSYCFAVENEAKVRLRKRLQKMLADPDTTRLIHLMLEDNRRSLSLHFHQYLLRLLRSATLEITMDNVFQTLQRMLEHGAKYKPDGLKALGIMLVCFGRSYSFRRFDREVRVDAPLALKGLAGEAEVLGLAALLTSLQHYRNPYIHPEISEMEKLSKIRATAFDALNIITRIG